MKKRLFIHLGTGKTGTTAIQRFLTENDDWLATNHRIQYATTERHNFNHHNLCTNYLRGESDNNSRVIHGLRDLLEEITTSDYETFVISSEYFPGVTPEEIAHVYAQELLDTIELNTIVYFRRQDDFAESWHAQIVKAGSPGWKGGIQNTVDRLTRDGIFDYYALAEEWARHIGKNHVFVKPYERTQFVNGDIIADFLSILGVDDLSGSRRTKGDPNPSLTRDQVHILESFVAAGIDSQIDGVLRKPFGIPSGSSSHLLSPDAREEILKTVDDGNSRLAREYLGRPDGILFRDPLPNETDADWQELEFPATGYLLRTVQHMIDRRFVQVRRQIEVLDKEVQRLKQSPSTSFLADDSTDGNPGT
ncbi:hypothetical protein [Brevibacterium samyangense]|uniref:Sulfotransferase family protein n=1 Tax=Brevibacterium samyangense TaxID=366888 RepID=A0ABN2TPI0_9MICO